MEDIPDDDNEIIRQVVGGDVNAFEGLIERYQAYVFSIVRKHVPRGCEEEVAQEVFIHAFSSLANFREESPFRYWLSKITLRRCYDFWRMRKSTSMMVLSTLSTEQEAWLEKVAADPSEVSCNEMSESMEVREILNLALEKLSPENRMVLILVYMEERPLKEVAELLGWSLTKTKMRSFRARQEMRKIIKKHL